MEKCDIPDNLSMLSYLTQVYDIFRGEIPYTHQKKILTVCIERLIEISSEYVAISGRKSQVGPYGVSHTSL